MCRPVRKGASNAAALVLLTGESLGHSVFRLPELSEVGSSFCAMSAGQVAFSVAADVAALDALAEELAVQELSRGAAHVVQLRTVLRMHAVGRAAGMEISTVPHAALALGCSEARAGQLLTDGLLLGELPGALEAVECGLLTVEQSARWWRS